MANLESMKKSKKDKAPDEIGKYKESEYPWGLQLHLEDASVDKLDAASLRAGDKVMIMAEATVSSVSSHEKDVDGGKVTISMSLQITDMALGEKPTDKKEQASRMFSGTSEDG